MNGNPIRIFMTLLMATLLSQIYGQVLHGPVPKSAGTTTSCGPALQVDLTSTPLGGLTHQFNAVIEGDLTVTGMLWTYHVNELQQWYGDSVLVQYEAPGESPVCVTVTALDATAALPCSTSTCRLVNIQPDPSCLEYQPDFSIANVDGQTIVFTDDTPYAGQNIQSFWNLPGTPENYQGPAVFNFDGPGPHEICLTLLGPAPYGCTATVCKWLYLGPGNVDCGQLLHPGFIPYAGENVGMFVDTSITSGQNSQVDWDFGDGHSGEGRVVIHFYEPFGGVYQVCQDVGLWGPLAEDTCHASSCEWVKVGNTLAAVYTHERGELLIHPNPATDQVILTGPRAGEVAITIFDATGRIVDQLITSAGDEPFTLDIRSLTPGLHVLQCIQKDMRWTRTFVKE